jgi:hypothetical protein
MTIKHPLTINTIIIANHKDCPCRGGKIISIQSSIQKVITNQSGTWYYLANGSTVNSNDVTGIQS